MNHAKRLSIAFVTAALLVSASAHADYDRRAKTYEVTITNLTKGQVFSPPVLVTHAESVALFELGEPALPELAIVAEDGDGVPLATLLSTLPQVYEAQPTTQPIPPGATETYLVNSVRGFNVLSIASMLVNSNDAFFAIDSEYLPWWRFASETFFAPGYDAGSEENNEDCGFVPGPACQMGSGNARATASAEGFVHVHNGVHGIADLAADAYDWRNPVAKVTVRRIR